MTKVIDSLVSAIKSGYLRSVLSDLNTYFYNRKHEGQIRDALLIEITKNSEFYGLSEYPKDGSGAVDLTLLYKNKNFNTAGVIEFKHHYPKDMNYKGCLDAIISDTEKAVHRQTTHFVLIMQVRSAPATKLLAPVKFMDRNDPDVQTYIKKLEDHKKFPSWIEKREEVVDVVGGIRSEYWFFIYKIRD